MSVYICVYSFLSQLRLTSTCVLVLLVYDHTQSLYKRVKGRERERETSKKNRHFPLSCVAREKERESGKFNRIESLCNRPCASFWPHLSVDGQCLPLSSFLFYSPLYSLLRQVVIPLSQGVFSCDIFPTKVFFFLTTEHIFISKTKKKYTYTHVFYNKKFHFIFQR